ncbi:MAG: dTDP-glucose 4,6-dehydratase [Desulfuromonas sp.]|nr:MAG: dTDP-glucose 4,6-dehydratase [Desulfuromonas sp.]
MKTVLVTGGCGFIGANFVKHVHAERPDWRVINLDKLTYAGNLETLSELDGAENYRFVKGDICDREVVEHIFSEEKIDSVVHFAAESHVDRSIEGPEAFITTNVMGTFTLLDVARKAWLVDGESKGRRFLHVSTDEVYGSLGDTGLFREDTPYDPRSPYSASKASSDHLASAYFHTYGLPVLITNCSNNYGPFQFPEKLIPLIINNAHNGKSLPVYGDGKNVRDWLYVVDHCTAILRVLEQGEVGETYNVGGNSEKQNIEVVKTICDLLDELVGLLPNGKPRQDLITFVKDRAGHDRRYAIDASKIKRDLGWEPSVTFESGIRSTISWFLENDEWMKGVLDGSYQNYYAKMYGER